MPSVPSAVFTLLTGVPVQYARPPLAPYGTRGVAYTFRASPAFRAKVEAAFNDLWTSCPLGKADLIVSAGFLVEKAGMHGAGRAMDLDSLWWKNKTWVASAYPFDQAFYLAVEAVFKRHFGVVLNYLYNPSHHDHLHINDTDAPGFSSLARSEVLFVQAALAHVFNHSVHITGEWMAETQAAVDAVFGGRTDLHVPANWRAFLARTIREGFGIPLRPRTPLDLLHDLYTLISHELAGDERRKRIEAGLNVFTNHDAVHAWLNQWRS